MAMLDDYRKGWALRYIREANDELRTSRQASSSIGLIIDAARKAQAAIYFSIGEPSSIESIVNEAAEGTETVENPVLRCLVEIEHTLQKLETLPPSACEEALKEADEIVSIASGIVDLLTSVD